MELPRASGILLHPTSLPGRFGNGDLGPEAHAFVDFLAETGQTWWQVLPLGPTGYGNSPYQSPSSFAGNPLLISPEGLVERGWLEPKEIAEDPRLPADRADFDAAAELRMGLLHRAFERFRSDESDPAFQVFRAENRAWLDDYVFFQALRDAHGGRPWYDWEPGLVRRDPAACDRWREEMADGIGFHEFVQYEFESQWQALRTACQAKGIRLIGDVPIFVAHDSADVWAHPDLYDLDEHGYAAIHGGRAAGLFQRDRPALGEPALSMGGARQGRLRVVGLPDSFAAQARGPHPDRPFPRLRGVLGSPRRVGDGGDRSMGPRAGPRILHGHREGARLRSRSSPRTWA